MSVETPAAQRSAFAGGAFLRVVNWHNTPEAERTTLRAELAWYAARYDPVLPEDLDRLFDTGRWGKDRPGFLPAFYDGYRNHATVAAPVCDELGLRAWFFPPTGLLDVPAAEQRAWSDGHCIDLVEEERGAERLAMTWDELEAISRRHVVAAHTASHAPAPQVLTEQDVEREVREPVRRIEALTGVRPPAFAWLHGAPYDPGSAGGRALVECGIRYAVSNLAYERIG